MSFQNRVDAGHRLARRLTAYGARMQTSEHGGVLSGRGACGTSIRLARPGVGEQSMLLKPSDRYLPENSLPLLKGREIGEQIRELSDSHGTAEIPHR